MAAENPSTSPSTAPGSPSSFNEAAAHGRGKLDLSTTADAVADLLQ